MNRNSPHFFQLCASATTVASVPLASQFHMPQRDELCRSCGARWQRYVGEPSCDIEGGAEWTDTIGVAARPLSLVSDRVVDSLREIGASGFKPVLVHIKAVRRQQLGVLPRPRYYFLEVVGRIEIDVEASGIGGVPRCGECFRNLSERLIRPRRYVPVEGTWDGSDIFTAGKFDRAAIFCTRRVLELARRDRWTNFRFDAMDVVQEHATGFSTVNSRYQGISYLGDRWPPERWYPDPPGAGKSIEQWLEQLGSEEYGEFFGAYHALIDLAAEAIPGLSVMIDAAPAPLRERAARVLALIRHNGLTLAPGLFARVCEALRDDPDFRPILTEARGS